MSEPGLPRQQPRTTPLPPETLGPACPWAGVQRAGLIPGSRAASGRDRPWPLKPAVTVLSEPERVPYRRLRQALPEHLVLTHVQLARALRFKRGRRDRAVWNRICPLSIDFLIVRADTSIVAAIEPDDSSHGRVDRQDADARTSHALGSAGIPLIRWRVGRIPDVMAMRAARRTPAPVTRQSRTRRVRSVNAKQCSSADENKAPANRNGTSLDSV